MEYIKKFLDKYYFIIAGIGSLLFSIFVFRMNLDQFTKVFSVLLTFSIFTCYKDIRRDIKWKPYLILSAPFFVFIIILLSHGYDIWHQILIYNWNKGFVIKLNEIFKKIPYNDASFARIFKTPWLTWYFRIVYNTGFILCVTIPIFRSAVAKDFKKILSYALSGHLFQIFLILPFYRILMLQEVWYVLNEPDGLARVFESEAIKYSWVMHCFPSMHTSVAFAMFLVVLREKDKIFKTVWSIYCLSIIYSTMYLEVHWTLDAIFGLLLGYLTVKLVDYVMKKILVKYDKKLKSYYYVDKREVA